MSFDKRLTEALEFRDMKQTELAKAVKSTPVTVSRWCNGHRIPKADDVRAICKALNCSADWLLELI